MEYTIARIINSKEVEGKWGPQHNVFFTTNETGDKGISVYSKFELKEGQKIAGEIEEKPGVNKKGEEVTYNNFKFSKTGGTMTEADRGLIKKAYEEAYAARTGVQLLRQELETLGVLKSPVAKIPGTNVEYPEQAKEVTFDPADIPFGDDYGIPNT